MKALMTHGLDFKITQIYEEYSKHWIIRARTKLKIMVAENDHQESR